MRWLGPLGLTLSYLSWSDLNDNARLPRRMFSSVIDLCNNSFLSGSPKLETLIHENLEMEDASSIHDVSVSSETAVSCMGAPVRVIRRN
ncbi:uncharacterized protein BT62DRAFT_1013933 [Guyanagaster necrorhizus]|uniref:Uncharacterized protein n=1 Tax=Guyanagaster necrorhizus TaxID=856835 RepID=A0A9P7VF71_9AGAR|nr:uncharacterized protein BT62DRAFT_1013933 [Guyanagaster necrorhizus MCA 3950]KAG7439448.1 hypothetical protein BT62DRAFT_1013933 [Guyanagaster necrorhizus MCA 3950]